MTRISPPSQKIIHRPGTPVPRRQTRRRRTVFFINRLEISSEFEKKIDQLNRSRNAIRHPRHIMKRRATLPVRTDHTRYYSLRITPAPPGFAYNPCPPTYALTPPVAGNFKKTYTHTREGIPPQRHNPRGHHPCCHRKHEQPCCSCLPSWSGSSPYGSPSARRAAISCDPQPPTATTPVVSP
jgi:hypothetical protein